SKSMCAEISTLDKDQPPVRAVNLARAGGWSYFVTRWAEGGGQDLPGNGEGGGLPGGHCDFGLTPRVNRLGGQSRPARSNTPDLSDPSADSLARSVQSRPRRS